MRNRVQCPEPDKYPSVMVLASSTEKVEAGGSGDHGPASLPYFGGGGGSRLGSDCVAGQPALPGGLRASPVLGLREIVS